MKMKKFISAIAAIAMVSTSLVSVSAAVKVEYIADYEMDIITEMPTADELLARRPSVAIKVEKLADQAAVKTETGDNGFAIKTKNYDVYKLTHTFTDIGALANGYDMDINTKWAGVANYTVAMDLRANGANVIYGTDGKEIYKINAEQMDGGTASAGLDKTWVDVNDSTRYNRYTVQWQCNTATTNPYPKFDSSNTSYVEDPTLSLVHYMVLAKGSSFELTANDVSAKVIYNLSGEAIPNNSVAVPAKITFGEVTPPAPAETKVVLSDKMNLEKNDVIGAAWDVTIENYDSEKDYMVTLKDGEEVRGGKAVALTGLNTVTEVEGDVSFALLVELSKARPALELAIEIQ